MQEKFEFGTHTQKKKRITAAVAPTIVTITGWTNAFSLLVWFDSRWRRCNAKIEIYVNKQPKWSIEKDFFHEVNTEILMKWTLEWVYCQRSSYNFNVYIKSRMANMQNKRSNKQYSEYGKVFHTLKLDNIALFTVTKPLNNVYNSWLLSTCYAHDIESCISLYRVHRSNL